MTRFLTTVLATALASGMPAAQEANPCDDADAVMTITTQLGGATDLYAVTGDSVERIGSTPEELNAFGYFDGFAYAMQMSSNVVVQLSLNDGVSAVNSFSVTDMPARGYRAGAVRPGTTEFYAAARDFAKIRRIPLDEEGASYTSVRINGEGSRIDIGDFAFWHDTIVGYDNDVFALLHFDPDTGESMYVQAPDLPANIYAAAYVVGESLFLYSDREKATYEVDPATGDVLSRMNMPFSEPTRQIDAFSCSNPPYVAACAPILDLRADVLALALPAVVEEELLSDLDAALVNCRRGEYTLTAAALVEFLAVVGLNAGVTIDLSDSELLTSVAQSLISGLPEDTTGNPCTPILDLRSDVQALGLSGALTDALLADLDVALVSCASGAVPELIAALNRFIGTVTVNTAPFGEISILDSTNLIAAANAIIALFPRTMPQEPIKGLHADFDRTLEAAAGARTAAVAAVETRVFPNPAVSRAIVQAPGPFAAKVYDVVGRLVLELDATSNTAEMNVRDLSPGLYVVRIDAADGVHTAKITVSR